VSAIACSQRLQAIMALASSFCGVAIHISAQQTKPNLSGTWKLNLGRSKLAALQRRGSSEYRIKHSEPRLVMEHVFDGRSETYSYMTDGKERVANTSLQGLVTRAKAYWEGGTLVIGKHQETSIGEATSIRRYTMSQDGQSLIVTEHVNQSPFSSAFDQLLFYQKQK
jgi:hypothetical protein